MNDVKCEQISNSINLVAQLPKGDSLVHLIGTGEEKSNFEALTNWIQQQEDLLEIESSERRVERLIERLRNKVNSFTEQFGY